MIALCPYVRRAGVAEQRDQARQAHGAQRARRAHRRARAHADRLASSRAARARRRLRDRRSDRPPSHRAARMPSVLLKPKILEQLAFKWVASLMGCTR